MRYWKPGRNSDLARAPGQRRARGPAHPAAGALGRATAARLQSRAVNLQAASQSRQPSRCTFLFPHLRSGCSLAGALQPKQVAPHSRCSAPGLPVAAAPRPSQSLQRPTPQALTVAAAPRCPSQSLQRPSPHRRCSPQTLTVAAASPTGPHSRCSARGPHSRCSALGPHS